MGFKSNDGPSAVPLSTKMLDEAMVIYRQNEKEIRDKIASATKDLNLVNSQILEKTNDLNKLEGVLAQAQTELASAEEKSQRLFDDAIAHAGTEIAAKKEAIESRERKVAAKESEQVSTAIALENKRNELAGRESLVMAAEASLESEKEAFRVFSKETRDNIVQEQIALQSQSEALEKKLSEVNAAVKVMDEKQVALNALIVKSDAAVQGADDNKKTLEDIQKSIQELNTKKADLEALNKSNNSLRENVTELQNLLQVRSDVMDARELSLNDREANVKAKEELLSKK